MSQNQASGAQAPVFPSSKPAKLEKLTGVKGMNDLLPPESARWEWLEATVRPFFVDQVKSLSFEGPDRARGGNVCNRFRGDSRSGLS